MPHVYLPAVALSTLVWRSAPQMPILSYTSEWSGHSHSKRKKRRKKAKSVFLSCSASHILSKPNLSVFRLYNVWAVLHLPLLPRNCILVWHDEVCWPHDASSAWQNNCICTDTTTSAPTVFLIKSGILLLTYYLSIQSASSRHLQWEQQSQICRVVEDPTAYSSILCTDPPPLSALQDI